VSFKQGLAVPLFCSVSLFGFYSLLRLFPNFDLRTFISAYLGLAGAVAVTSNLTPPLRLLLPTPDNLRWKIEFPKWLVEDEGRSVHLTITPAEIVATLCMSLTYLSYLLALFTPLEAVDWWCAVM
jgi:hypothetical protein